MMPLLTNLTNKILHQKVLSDKLSPYPLLTAISQNGHYTLAAFAILYLALISFWLPAFLLSKLLTEFGVYLFLISSVVYIGRCVLRLLAFPGTNVKVYGEIELEFARYSCKLLEGVGGALEGFGRAVIACNNNGSSESGSDGDFNSPKKKSTSGKSAQILGSEYSASDVPTAYKRVILYRDKVLGVYWQVLHCLLKEGGKGYDYNSTTAESDFYARDVMNACKRNLCCGTTNNSYDDVRASDVGSRIAKNKFGNNTLIGDIGNMMNVSPEARSHGVELYSLLTLILDDLSALVESAYNLLEKIDKGQFKGTVVSEEAIVNAEKLIQRSVELRTFITKIKPPSSSSTHSSSSNNEQVDEESVGPEAVRHRLEENGTTSTLGMISTAFTSFMSMIDPPPHPYIFGLDVIRGCFLSRYRGARQFWVRRSSGCNQNGCIDVIHIPSQCEGETMESVRLPMSPRQGRESHLPSCSDGTGKKAVLYCNPNAGLAEVATGLGLIGGNTDSDDENEEPTCWTEYYLSHGYDVYLFNYCGYGRSYGGGKPTEFRPGCFGSLGRLFHAVFVSFKPTSQTLKLDACAVAKHILECDGVDQLVIHGESIGGMAAAGAARALSPIPSANSNCGGVSLLICDRTFCNLEAVAQRLVGAWTGNAIRLLTFNSWNTDVLNDFLAAKCPKVVANDAADEIIHDYSSLKSGLAFASELTRGMTNGIGWMMSAPMEYRMADLENVSFTNSSALTFKAFQVNPPTWPADKRVTWKEAFHFAFCVKRIGKLATAAKKANTGADANIEQEGIEVSFSDDSIGHSSSMNETKPCRLDQSELIDLWNTLSCCDGLCGRPLGQAVKEGFDCTVSWLCCAVVMGSQVVAKAAEKRIQFSNNGSATESLAIQPKDFDCRPIGYQRDESETMKHPIPLPNVLSFLKVCRRSRLQDVEAEFNYVIGMIEYLVQRISSTDIAKVSTSWHSRCVDDHTSISTGCFLNLHCGHNNQYSPKERDDLLCLIRKACGDSV